MSQQLPEPRVANWEELYSPLGAKARCIKDNPPMKGFGRALKVGDIVRVHSVCWEDRYTIGVQEECAFYDLEGYFEVVI